MPILAVFLLQSIGFGLVFFVCCESFSGFQDPPGKERVERAIQLLDNPRWHEVDSEVNRYRRMDGVPENALKDRIVNVVGSREFQALTTVLESDVPKQRLAEMLRRWLNHPRDNIVLGSAAALIRRGDYAASESIIEAMRARDPDYWGAVTQAIITSGEFAKGVDLARVALKAALDRREPSIGQSPGGVETDAARILLHSNLDSDQALVVDTVRKLSDVPMLWIIASRLPSIDAIIADARRTYSDTTLPRELRDTAGVVVALNEPAVWDDVFPRVLEYLREFSGPAFEQWLVDELGKGGSERDRGKSDRMTSGLVYYAVLREAPHSKVCGSISELLRPDEGAINKTTAAVIARICPVEFLELAERRRSLDESWFESLWLIALDRSDLRRRVEELIPAHKRNVLDTRIREVGKDAALTESALTLTLWEQTQRSR